MNSTRENFLASGLPAGEPAVAQAALWIGLLGGGVAWLVHLLAAYVLAEFGCLSGWGRSQYLGVTVLAWLLLAVSVLTLLGAGGAAWVAHCSRRRLSQAAPPGAGGPEWHLARTGYITSGFFIFIILVESLPIFFFLQGC